MTCPGEVDFDSNLCGQPPLVGLEESAYERNLKSGVIHPDFSTCRSILSVFITFLSLFSSSSAHPQS